MPDFSSLLLFISTSFILAFTPGPDNIFVLTQSITGGKYAGIKITFGLCTGLIFHTFIVAMGISVIFQTSLIAFSLLKYLGVIYLLYLAWKAFKSAPSNITTNNSGQLSNLQLFSRGIIMNITNPKVSIFFMAFLPQFTSAKNGSITLQLIILGIIFILVTLLSFSLISFLAGIIGKWINKHKTGDTLLNRVAGIVFTTLAIKLVFTEQK